MARVYVAEGQDQGDVARALLELAGDDPSVVKVIAGEGMYGAFEVPDDLADQYKPDQVKRRDATDDADDADARTKPATARERRAAAAADKTAKTDS